MTPQAPAPDDVSAASAGGFGPEAVSALDLFGLDAAGRRYHLLGEQDVPEGALGPPVPRWLHRRLDVDARDRERSTERPAKALEVSCFGAASAVGVGGDIVV